MSPGETAVAELIDCVRARVPDDAGATALRVALEAELERVGRAHAADPAGWAAWADGFDVVGTAYESLISGAERRAAGQFQTPLWAADLMAGWLLQEPVRLLLDPGVGAGRLLFRAAAHPKAPKQLLGLDVDPVSLTMARVNLHLRGIEDFELRGANFLLEALPERPDALICNPPYSRHHAIAAAEKEAIHAGFETRLGQSFSRLAGLHVLFLVRALEVLGDGGRLAFITPAQWLDVGYGRAVKRWLLAAAQVEALVIFRDDHVFFDGALTTAAVTLLRKEQPSTAPTKVIRLPRKLPEVDAVLGALRGEGTLAVDEVSLRVDEKWGRQSGRAARGRPLAELARVRRGIATGCNRFFVISEATRQQWRLRRSDLRPCITTPRVVPGLELTQADIDAFEDEVPRWALDRREPGEEEADTALGSYLRWGKGELGADQSYLARHRQPWYALEQRGSCPILFTYMNREQPRFIRNHADAVPLNTFLIVEPAEGVDAHALCNALNHSHFLRQLKAKRRDYGGGLWKLEPSELSQLCVRL